MPIGMSERFAITKKKITTKKQETEYTNIITKQYILYWKDR